MNKDVTKALTACLQELHLPVVRAQYEAVARQASAESWSYPEYLLELLERERQQRRQNRIERLLRESRLPLEKNWAALDLKRLPPKAVQQLRGLLSGDFLDRRENILVFGPPGSGKSHALCAVAQELVRAGRPFLFTTTALLVQELLAAKRDLALKASSCFFGDLGPRQSNVQTANRVGIKTTTARVRAQKKTGSACCRACPFLFAHFATGYTTSKNPEEVFCSSSEASSQTDMVFFPLPFSGNSVSLSKPPCLPTSGSA
jgi:hypothetical protein